MTREQQMAFIEKAEERRQANFEKKQENPAFLKMLRDHKGDLETPCD